jgi:hypothetical protein
MNRFATSRHLCVFVLSAGLWGACSAKSGTQAESGSSSSGTMAGSGDQTTGASSTVGGPGEASSASVGGGSSGAGGAGASSAAASTAGESTGSASDGSGSLPGTGASSSAGGGSSGAANSSTMAGSGSSTSGGTTEPGPDASTHESDASGSGGSVVAPAGCTLPATVSFKTDVLPFLTTSCGGGNGCHIIDNASTTANGGYDHGYDWITAGAHASSCPETPTPFRYQVVIAVINEANPPTCSKSRKMPPPGQTGANARTDLTACQIATLQAWLDEPLVVQMHRADDSSPTTPYPMPPFN